MMSNSPHIAKLFEHKFHGAAMHGTKYEKYLAIVGSYWPNIL